MNKIVVLVAAFLLISYHNCFGANYYQIAAGNWNSLSIWSSAQGSSADKSILPGSADNVYLYPDIYGSVSIPSGYTPGSIANLYIYVGSTTTNFTGTMITNSSNSILSVSGATNLYFQATSSIITITVSFIASGTGGFTFNNFNLQFPSQPGNSAICKFQSPTVTFNGTVTCSASGINLNNTSNLTMDFLNGTVVNSNGTIGSFPSSQSFVSSSCKWNFLLESGATLNLAGTSTFGSLSSYFINYINFVSGSTVNYTGTAAQNIFTTSTPNLAGASSSTAFGYSNLKIANTAGIASVLSGTLNVSGNFTNATGNSGTNYIDFTTNATTLNLTGGTQTISTTSTGNQTKFYNLTVASTSSATLSGAAGFAISSKGILTLSTAATFATAGLLTLLSDVNGCASFAPVLNSGSVTGNVIVQRYLSGSSSGVNYRGYRLLSSPVYVATAPTVGNYDKIQNCIGATFLTGTGGTTNGFDQAGNPTIYFFTDNSAPSNKSFTSGNWGGVYNMKTGVSNSFYVTNYGTFNGYKFAGNGFLLFFRGSRSTVNPYNPSTYALASVLCDTGKINIGQITVCKYNSFSTPLYLDYTTSISTNTAVRGFNLLGNPYACTIDWNTSTTGGFTMTNVSNTIYTLNLNGTYGTYQWNGTTGTATNNGSRYIASGQGFFVKATAANPTFTFTENAKVTGVNFNPVQTGLGTTTELSARLNTGDQHLLLSLNKDTINFEESFIGFNKNASTKLVVNEDAGYLFGSSLVHLATLSSDNAKLVINRQPLPTLGTSVIPLSVSANANGSYSLNLKEISGIPSIYRLVLKDNYLKDSINLRTQSSYTFTINNSDTLSYGPSRFVLMINEDPSLMVRLNSFSAKPNFPGTAIVSWTTQNEFNYTSFEVEKSTDNGRTYNPLDTLLSTGAGSYNMTDSKPGSGTSYYRIKITDLNGTVTYSPPVKISYNKDVMNAAIIIYPNPATSQTNITVNTSNQQLSQGYIFKIFNESGREVLSAKSSSATWQANLNGLGVGIYFVQVYANESLDQIGKGKLVKQ